METRLQRVLVLGRLVHRLLDALMFGGPNLSLTRIWRIPTSRGLFQVILYSRIGRYTTFVVCTKFWPKG